MHLLKFKPFDDHRHMKGFIDLKLASGMVLRGLKLMQGDKGGWWIASPARQYEDDEGSKQYYDYITFADQKQRDRFRDEVVLLLKADGYLTDDQQETEGADDIPF